MTPANSIRLRWFSGGFQSGCILALLCMGRPSAAAFVACLLALCIDTPPRAGAPR